MTEPSRAPDTHGTEAESAGQLDVTLARPGGDVVLSPLARKVREPEFDPPAAAGEVGTLGRYRVLKKLGQGGMGAVYLGYDVKLGRKVALKVMLPDHAEDPESRARFLREARAAAMLKSDHVVTLFDVGDERAVAFIAMEYLLGSPLDQYLRNIGELPLAQVFRIGRETAQGLAAAHDLGLVHRDIKPGNIWLEAPRGRVKILDFGLARAANDDTHLTTTGLVVGTPAFMSPEQARGQPLDGRSDLFSLGIVLYRLATGKMPFDGTTTMALLTSLAVDDPVPIRQVNPAVPPALAAVIHKLLAKKADDRYATAWEAAAALRDAERAPAADGQLPIVVQPVSMAVAAQPDNVWAGIEESASHAVPISSGTSAVATDTPPPRRKPDRAPSKAPILLAIGAMVAAVAVLAAVLMWPKKKPEVAEKEPDKVSPEKRASPAPKVASDPDRRAAEYVLAAGGTVRVNDADKDVGSAADLPKGSFTLARAFLSLNKSVTDGGLSAFRGCTNLTFLDLGGTRTGDAGVAHLRDCKSLAILSLHSTDVTDAGVAHLRDFGGLTYLRLNNTRVTDAALAHLDTLPRLSTLDLEGTPVTDAGLKHLEVCKSLEGIELRRTKVTAAGVQKLAEALPGCRIDWDGGVIEPAGVPLDPDRRAARYALSVDGSVAVTLGGRGFEVKTLTDLPNEPFNLITFNVSRTEKVTDAGLAAVRGCRNIRYLYLNSSPNLTDEGMKHFAGMTNVADIMLYDTRVTDEGLGNFKGCKNLNALNLDHLKITDDGVALFKDCKTITHLSVAGTPVTDATLERCKGFPNLMTLIVRNTKVTPGKVAELAKALPRCKIEHDGGTIEPRPDSGADRAAAEWVISVGGEVQVNDAKTFFNAAAALPRGELKLKTVLLRKNPGATDANLARFAQCSDVTGLTLVACPVTDDGLVHVKHLAAGMEVLQLDDTAIGDKGLAHFAGAARLRVLSLTKTKAGDAGLASFKGCKDLNSLYLQNTSVGDTGLAHLKDCTMITVFLDGTAVTDAGLAVFKNQRTLNTLALTGTAVTDAGLIHLAGCRNLRSLRLTKTKVTGEGAAALAKLLPVCKIDYDGGTIEPPKK